MQRVEPSKIQEFEEATLGEHQVLPRAPLPAFDEPLTVEARPAHLPQESGGSLFWGTCFFCFFWLGGIGAYLTGLIGWAQLFTLPVAWYGLIVAVLLVPVVLAIFIALLAREAKILRGQSSALAIVAAELSEPEEHAARGMTRLGHAIRRELDVFNAAVETATSRMAALDAATAERMQMIERTSVAAQERVDRATAKLGAERDKLAQFTQALDTAVLAASDTLTSRLQEARTAARTASENLHSEHNAIAGLIATLQTASATVSNRAVESAKEIERQAQRLDAASEAVAARSEQVVVRHERQRAALAETIDRLKQENDHMARALDFQREGLSKLVGVMVDESKKIGTFTIEGTRRLDETAAIMAQRIVETTQLFTRESEKLRTSTELTTSGLEQAMQTIRTAGDSSFDAAGRLGSVLISLRETAATASQQIEASVDRLGKLTNQMPAAAADQAQRVRVALDQQAGAVNDFNTRVSGAFERVRQAEPPKAPPLPAPAQQQAAPSFNVPPAANLAPPPRHQVASAADQRPLPLQQQDIAPDQQQRGWFGLGKRFGRPADTPDTADDRGSWDMKSLLAAAETETQKPAIQHTAHQAPPPARPPQQPAPAQPRMVELRPDQMVPESTVTRAPHPATPPPSPQQQRGAKPAEQPGTSSRHMIETLQAMAIDLDRFLEDDPPMDLLRRYRSGERNVFARRLVQVLGREQAEQIGRKYREDGEFRDTVDRYVLQFEALMEQTARTDRDNVLVETYLTSQTGKVYVALASAIGRLS